MGRSRKSFPGCTLKGGSKRCSSTYLTTLNLARFLTEEAPQIPDGVGNVQVVSALDAWKHSDFLCRNYVLNGLVDSLYNVYYVTKTAKKLWDSLDKNIKLKIPGPRNLWSLGF